MKIERTRFFYLDLALQSMKENYRVSVPCLGGGMILCGMFYAMVMVYSSDAIYTIFYPHVYIFSSMGSPLFLFFPIFILLFFFYLNSVFIRSRQDEQKILILLGMERIHLLRIEFDALAVLWIGSLLGGILLGSIFERLLFLLLCRLMDAAPIYGFSFSAHAFSYYLISVSLIFLIQFLYSALHLYTSRKPHQKEMTVPRRERLRSHTFKGLLGLVCLLGGYAIALGSYSVYSVYMAFLLAILLVIIGTWLIYRHGMSLFLSLLTKKKSFFYTPEHFISISILRSRLKQNATALASIALLSTMVLITLSVCLSMITGADRSVELLLPFDAQIELHSFVMQDGDTKDAPAFDPSIPQIEEDMRNLLSDFQIHPSELIAYASSDLIVCDPEDSGYHSITIIDIDDYNRFAPSKLQLEDNQLLPVFSSPFNGGIQDGTLYIKNQNQIIPYSILEFEDSAPRAPLPDSSSSSVFIGKIPSDVIRRDWTVLFNVPADELEILNELDSSIGRGLSKTDYPDENVAFSIETQSSKRNVLRGVYSSLFFLGLCVSVLFMLALILILYYKQLSEGKEDRRRFAILRDAGVEKEELTRLIRNQSRFVFFLPLATALVHIVFAVPIVQTLLAASSIRGFKELELILAICFCIFSAIYILVYALTARTCVKVLTDES